MPRDTSIHVDLILACTVMADKFEGLREPIYEFTVEVFSDGAAY